MIPTQRGGTLIGLALGLMAGLLIALGVVWYLNRSPLPFVDKVVKQEPKDTAAGKPVALPGKPGDKPIDKPGDKSGERKFEFYDILEGKKQAPANVGPAPAAKAESGTTAKTEPSPGPKNEPAPPARAETPAAAGMYLQVGAFQKKADADNLRARLAMLGFEAGVLETDTPDKGKMHRVRVGPYGSAEEMNRVRTQLSQNGVSTTVVKGKE